MRIESSFAGIGYVTLFGSVLESIAIVGMSSLVVIAEYWASTITTRSGNLSYLNICVLFFSDLLCVFSWSYLVKELFSRSLSLFSFYC